MRVSLRPACSTTRPRVQIYTVTSVCVCIRKVHQEEPNCMKNIATTKKKCNHKEKEYSATFTTRQTMCLQTPSEDETISVEIYTNTFGVTTVKISYGPIRFTLTSTTRPVIHQWTNDEDETTVMIHYQQMRLKLVLSCLATNHTHHQCPLLASKETPYSIPIPESEWGRCNRKRSELVLDWRPQPHEVYGALLSGISQRQVDNSPHPTPATFLTPTQESQPWDETKSEAVFPPLNTHRHSDTTQTSTTQTLNEFNNLPYPTPTVVIPRQESQPWDKTKSEAVFPSKMKLTRYYMH